MVPDTVTRRTERRHYSDNVSGSKHGLTVSIFTF
jgi:hypothetical protein